MLLAWIQDGVGETDSSQTHFLLHVTSILLPSRKSLHSWHTLHTYQNNAEAQIILPV